MNVFDFDEHTVCFFFFIKGWEKICFSRFESTNLWALTLDLDVSKWLYNFCKGRNILLMSDFRKSIQKLQTNLISRMSEKYGAFRTPESKFVVEMSSNSV